LQDFNRKSNEFCSRILLLISLLLALAESSVFLDCNFKTSGYVYYCEISNVIITSENETVFIGRYHAGTYNDAKVTRLDFVSSSLSHIPNEIFQTFKNLNTLYVTKTKLKNLNRLSNCTNLVNLYAFNNDIEEVKTESLAACTNLRNIQLYNNPIHRLNDGFFNKSILKLNLRLENCRINSIQPSFLDDVKEMSLNLKNNSCIKKEFSTITPAKLDGIKPYFFKCFENFKVADTSTVTNEWTTSDLEESTTSLHEELSTSKSTHTTTEELPTTEREETSSTIETTRSSTYSTLTSSVIKTTTHWIDWTSTESTYQSTESPPSIPLETTTEMTPTGSETLETTTQGTSSTPTPWLPNSMNCTFNIFKMKYHCETDIDLVFFH
jgi:hypothetical protein